MKLYTCTGAPSPRRVTLYLQAKGIEIDQIEVDLKAGEHLSADFLAKSPDGTVPLLELEGGDYLWDSMAIRRYLEDRFPEPALMGTTAESRAEVLQWSNWVIGQGLQAVAEAFRNKFSGFKNHALTGTRPTPQIEALAERGLARYPYFLDDLESRLQSVPFVGGQHFSIADIDALVTVEFAAEAIKIAPGEGHSTVLNWQARINDRLETDRRGQG